MTKSVERPKEHKRVWLWTVTPFLFLAVGTGAFFGLKYYFENNVDNVDTNENFDMAEEEILEDEENKSDFEDPEKFHSEEEESAQKTTELAP